MLEGLLQADLGVGGVRGGTCFGEDVSLLLFEEGIYAFALEGHDLLEGLGALAAGAGGDAVGVVRVLERSGRVCERELFGGELRARAGSAWVLVHA